MSRALQYVILFAAGLGLYCFGRYEESLQFRKRIEVFSAYIECPDPEWLYMKSFDFRTGETKCRYFFRGRRT